MTTIVEAVYENGVLKPVDSQGLKEHQRYRIILEELREPEAPSDPALAAELERATCLCLPSRGEGVPMSVLEAMAARCPVVTTLAGGLVDLVEDDVNGFVVAVDDAVGLADALVRVIADRGARERVAETAARTVAETHGVQRVDRCLYDLYSEALGSRAASAPAMTER